VTWHTPGAVRIDPDADKPKLISSRWRRRDPVGDPYDLVDITGVFDLGPDAGSYEIVLRPVEFAPTLSATAESFAANYTRADAVDDVSERLAARLRELEARG
jgi:hypothetical protein